MIVYKVSLNGTVGYVTSKSDLHIILEEVKELNKGDRLTIDAMEMSVEKFEMLNEFGGW